MRNLKEFEDYDGCDADIKTSLYEYGLIWKSINKVKFFYDPENPNSSDEYTFIYGISYDNNSEYNGFDHATMSVKEFRELLKESWLDLPAILSYCGMNEENFINDFPYCISTLISYYGYENIFGGSYGGFEIGKEDDTV